MRWTWKRRQRHQRSLETRSADRPDPDAARRDLERTKAKWPEVSAVVDEVREWHRRNHFAERIEASFRGDHA